MTQYNATLLWFIKAHPEYKKVLKYLYGTSPDWCLVPGIKKIFNLDKNVWRKFVVAASSRNGTGLLETTKGNDHRAYIRAKPMRIYGLNQFLKKVEDI